jgi:hypothetical protein
MTTSTKTYEVKKNTDGEWDVIGPDGEVWMSFERKSSAIKQAARFERDDLIEALTGRIEKLSLETLRTLATKVGA